MANRPKFVVFTSPSPEQKQHLRLANTPLTFPVLPKKLQQTWLSSTSLSQVPRAAAIAACLLVLLAVISFLRSPSTPAAAAQQEQAWPAGLISSSCNRRSSSRVRQRAGNAGAAAGDAAQTVSVWRRPVVLLLGDSLTELGQAEDGGWSIKLTSAYTRKADVLNRGFSGFNTHAALLALCEITDNLSRQQVLLATVWLGANDAALLGRRDASAHVPLEQYRSNLLNITSQLRAAGVQHVVLLTPPPVNDAAPDAVRPGEGAPPRLFNTTAQYAAAVRAAAAQTAVLLLDVWQLFLKQPSWKQQLLASDGLHLSKRGQQEVYQALMQLVEQQLPDLRPSALPWHHPNWRSLYENPEKQFAAEQAAYQQEHGDPACCSLG
ncbi:SGNH hydrolase-type esterase domain-containing protein [Scenedesmus sp. NREL 46B-D3]|nr:SGNH hydrolase-type esterase domain-containing protein [Scenedesmus sp. NREL 46B-D3]